jgi:hypothetical protein
MADEIKALIDAVAWWPMESAPKNGTRVLIYVPDDDDGEVYKVAYWGDLAARPGWWSRGWWGEESAPVAWKPLDPPPFIEFES